MLLGLRVALVLRLLRSALRRRSSTLRLRRLGRLPLLDFVVAPLHRVWDLLLLGAARLHIIGTLLRGRLRVVLLGCVVVLLFLLDALLLDLRAALLHLLLLHILLLKFGIALLQLGLGAVRLLGGDGSGGFGDADGASGGALKGNLGGPSVVLVVELLLVAGGLLPQLVLGGDRAVVGLVHRGQLRGTRRYVDAVRAVIAGAVLRPR